MGFVLKYIKSKKITYQSHQISSKVQIVTCHMGLLTFKSNRPIGKSYRPRAGGQVATVYAAFMLKVVSYYGIQTGGAHVTITMTELKIQDKF